MLPEDVHNKTPYSGRHAKKSADTKQPLASLQHVDTPRQTPGRKKLTMGNFSCTLFTRLEPSL